MPHSFFCNDDFQLWRMQTDESNVLSKTRRHDAWGVTLLPSAVRNAKLGALKYTTIREFTMSSIGSRQ